MLKYGSNDIGKVYLGSNSIGKAYYGSDLVYQRGSSPTPPPYTPVDYIETDGDAYINTGVNGNDPCSCECKFSVGSLPGSRQCILGTETGAENTSLYVLANINAGGELGFGHRYYYSNPDFSTTAQNAFEIKCAMKNGTQVLQRKLSGESSFTSYSKTQSSTITTGKTMYLFAANNANTSAINKCSSGSRIYYCKIYSTNTYTTLVRNFVPCYYNGEYGLWDKVSNSFFGAVLGSGVFTGPSIS